MSAVHRIADFLQRDVRHMSDDVLLLASAPTKVEVDAGTDLVALNNAGFELINVPPVGDDDLSSKSGKGEDNIEVGPYVSSNRFVVSQFDNVALKRGEILAVCGPVGSGKSTFVKGLIDEVPTLVGSRVSIQGSVALVPQLPFVLNATLRDNILFGRPFDKELYDRVLDACCLLTDIDLLGDAGDMTEIGERGVTLSGGQKQRVSLARAAYAEPDVILLDDPLSALDANTAKRVFEKLIRSPSSNEKAFFANTAVVLVTHASHFLNQVDRVTLIVEGQNKFYGTWDELRVFEPTDHGEATIRAVNMIVSTVQEDGKKAKEKVEAKEVDELETKSEKKKKKDKSKGNLISAEEREHGLSSIGIWFLWFRYAGGIWFLVMQVLLLSIDRFFYVMVEFWISMWTDAADKRIERFGISLRAQSEGIEAQYGYLTVYAILMVVSVIATTSRSQWAGT